MCTQLQERPIDTVVEGFIHLQQYHATEVARGLSGMGCYRLRQGFPVCDTLPPCNSVHIQPDQIVTTLQQPTAEVHRHLVTHYSGFSIPFLFGWLSKRVDRVEVNIVLAFLHWVETALHP